MSNQLKILVKRADGTTVRMTMDEVKGLKSRPQVEIAKDHPIKSKSGQLDFKTKNDKKYRTTCKTIIFLSYHIQTCGSSTGGASTGVVGAVVVVCFGGLASETTNFLPLKS